MRKQTVWCQMSNLQGKNEWCNRAARVEVTFEGRRLKVCEEHGKRLAASLTVKIDRRLRVNKDGSLDRRMLRKR